MLPDDVPLGDASQRTKLSGTQLASSLGLDIINNVREARDALHRMANAFRVRNAHLAKPHSYKVGDEVLLSAKNVLLNLPCKKMSPTYVGPFTINVLLGDNAVNLNLTDRFRLLNSRVNIVYLRSYRLRTPDIGHGECLVRWKDFDDNHDSWIRRHSVTPLTLCAYEDVSRALAAK